MRKHTLFSLMLLASCGQSDPATRAPEVDSGLEDRRDEGVDSPTDRVDMGTPSPDVDTPTDLAEADFQETSPDTGPNLDDLDADVTARLSYINQRVFREDEFFARGGTATIELITPQELPADPRGEFFNEDGERCTFEMGSQWPEVSPDGSTWPAPPFLDGGRVRLEVEGAPGPVVFGYLDTYYVRTAPEAVKLGNITHSSFFEPTYIPHGQPAQLSTLGGPALGAFDTTVDLASDYVVSAPALEAGGDIIDTDAPLDFAWSPASPGDTMVVIVKDSFGFIKCTFADDGSATVPADAMATLIGGQFVRVTIQTWREHEVTQRVMSDDGQVVDVQFLSRHVQIGRFDSL